MNATRMMKEVRQLAWPWAFVTCASVLSLFHLPQLGFLSTAHVLEIVVVAGAFFGIPLLATIPIGSEFQHRTLGLYLAQPIPREAVWRLKMTVTVMAIVVPAALYSRSIHWESGPAFWLGVAVLTGITAGAMFWTLVARSIIGGLGLSACAVGAGEVVWLYLADQFGVLGRRGQPPESWVWGAVMASVVYSAIMIWLGRRKILTFQAMEGMQAGETVIPGARLVPGFVTDWFRARPTGPILNLVRREFHLLRLIWALVVLLLLDWIFIVSARLVDVQTATTPVRTLQIITVAGAMTVSGLIAILAGVLSLGEEKNWGTHEWHMTVPVSTTLQWAVKLAVALFTGIVGATLPPFLAMVIRGWMQGSPSLYLPPREVMVIIVGEIALLTIAGFWCACVVKGTMRAVLWVFPFFFALGLAAEFGIWIFSLMKGPAASFFQDVIWKYDPIAVSSKAGQIVDPRNLLPLAALVLAPGVAIATMQSYRLFRAQAEDSKLHILKSVAPLAVTAAICGFVVAASVAFTFQAWEERGTLVRETVVAMQSLQPGESGSAQPLQLTADALAKASPVSDRTRQWLAGSRIEIASSFPELHAPEPASPASRLPMTFSINVPALQGHEGIPYAAVIHRPSGTTCYVGFSTARHARFGFASGQCQ